MKRHPVLHRLSHASRMVCWWVLLVRKVAGQLCYLCNRFWVWLGHSTDVQLSVALLLNLWDHPLESGTTAHSEKDLGGDAIGDALQALLHKGLALENAPKNVVDFKDFWSSSIFRYKSYGRCLSRMDQTFPPFSSPASEANQLHLFANCSSYTRRKVLSSLGLTETSDKLVSLCCDVCHHLTSSQHPLSAQTIFLPCLLVKVRTWSNISQLIGEEFSNLAIF